MTRVDTNVAMHAAGAGHPNDAPAVRLLALHRWTEGRQVYALARELFPEVLPVTGEVMDRAKLLADADGTLSARDAVHAAVVSVYRLAGIHTFDQDFDRIPGCKRVAL